MVVLGVAEGGQGAVLVQPLLGQQAERAVAERDELLAFAQGGEQLGQWRGEPAEVDLAVELEPVDAALDL